MFAEGGFEATVMLTQIREETCQMESCSNAKVKLILVNMLVEESTSRDAIGFIWDSVKMLKSQQVPIAALCTEAIPTSD